MLPREEQLVTDEDAKYDEEWDYNDDEEEDDVDEDQEGLELERSC